MPPLSRPETEHKISFSSEALLAAKPMFGGGSWSWGIGAALGAAGLGLMWFWQNVMGIPGRGNRCSGDAPDVGSHSGGAFQAFGQTTLYPTDHGEGQGNCRCSDGNS